MLSDFENVLDRLKIASRNGNKAMAFCPAHDDKNSASLSVKAQEDKLLLHCFADCTIEEVVAAVGLEMGDLFADGAGKVVPLRMEGVSVPPNGIETVKHSPAKPPETAEPTDSKAVVTSTSCTLEEYADTKGLPVEFLRGVGLTDLTYKGRPAVRVPYLDEHGQVVAVRFRTALDGADKFRWRSGDKPRLYGLPLLNKVREAGYAVLVEGESDAHTLWFHEIPALGVPGASSWNDEWASALEGIEKVYAVVEPDDAGEALWRALANSDFKDRLYRVNLEDAKDASELHLRDQDRFKERIESAMRGALTQSNIAESEARERAREAWAACEGLAREPNILGRFAEELARSGVAGESRTAKILYLTLTSRLLGRPVSVALKGPSSGGKSYLVEQVLRFYPESAYYALTAMSEHALAYDEEPIAHRFLVIFEASGMEGDLQTYFVRSLLSEGRLRYVTVERTSDGVKPRLIERPGPTGLIVTTTAPRLHPENETRLISLTVADTREQTRDILAALAEEYTLEVDLEPWLALQRWLEDAERRVTIPYAKDLAHLVSPVAVRLRRDFGALLNLIRAHGVLHQATRERSSDGRVIATMEDYASVRDLIVDLVSEGLEATVPPIVRETVEAVARLLEEGKKKSATSREVGEELRLEKGPVSRRVRMALDAGYLRNLEDQRGRPARLILGDPMPEDLHILPTVEELKREHFTVPSAPEKGVA